MNGQTCGLRWNRAHLGFPSRSADHRLADMEYTADITPTEAHDMLVADEDAVLVDCRTQAEWTFVGVPEVDSSRFVEWTRWPDGGHNENFIRDVAGGLSPEQSVIVICRTGGRSAAAAAALTQAGFAKVYNVTDGFEGHVGTDGHRAGGWKGAGLPWRQG